MTEEAARLHQAWDEEAKLGVPPKHVPLSDDPSENAPLWTASQDAFLIEYGKTVGYGFVAWHDLGRSHEEGEARIEWLRTRKPRLVRQIEKRTRTNWSSR